MKHPVVYLLLVVAPLLAKATTAYGMSPREVVGVDLINRSRVNHGVSAVARTHGLALIARHHAERMKAKGRVFDPPSDWLQR